MGRDEVEVTDEEDDEIRALEPRAKKRRPKNR